MVLQMVRKQLWENEKLLVMSNFSFSHSVFKRLEVNTRACLGNSLINTYSVWLILPLGAQLGHHHANTTSSHTVVILFRFRSFSKRQILDPSKLKEIADDNLELYENGRWFSKRLENTVGNGEIACYEQFLLFPQCFQKTCTADT